MDADEAIKTAEKKAKSKSKNETMLNFRYQLK